LSLKALNTACFGPPGHRRFLAAAAGREFLKKLLIQQGRSSLPPLAAAILPAPNGGKNWAAFYKPALKNAKAGASSTAPPALTVNFARFA